MWWQDFLWGFWNGLTAWIILVVHVFGGWHQYPGATPPDAGPRPTISAAWQSWRFFAGRRLAVPGSTTRSRGARFRS